MAFTLPIDSASVAQSEIVYQAPIMKTFESIVSEIHPDHFATQEYLLKFLKDGYEVDGQRYSYTEAELKKIYDDYQSIYNKTFETAEKGRVYITTAGGPGAGKSTVLEKELEFERDQSVNHLVMHSKKFAYIDPDRAALFFMKNTYCKDLQADADPTRAYNKWRGASNFIANTLLAMALKEGYNIAHGTTMTAPALVVEKLLTKIAEVYHYAIEMHHVTAPDQVRVDSVKSRNMNGIVQETGDDLVQKGKALFERYPLYLKHIPVIHFWWRNTLGDAVKVATKKENIIEIYDMSGYCEIMRLHTEKKEKR